MPKLMEFLFGSGDKLKKVEQFDPQQKQMFKQIMNMLMQQGGGGIGGAFNVFNQYLDPNSDIYKNLETNALQQFQEQDVPRLAEQFAGYGGGMGGGLSSSGFGQALGGAQAGLRRDILGQKMQMQRGAASDMMGMLQSIMGMQPFGYQRLQGGPGYVPTMAGMAMQGFGGGY